VAPWWPAGTDQLEQRAGALLSGAWVSFLDESDVGINPKERTRSDIFGPLPRGAADNVGVALFESPRNAAYDLAKLTGKKLVHRIERSRRYAVDPSGVRTLCAYLLLREKVIKPLLAGVTRPYRRSPKIIAPLDQHYLKLRQELHQTFETIGFAAA